MSINRLLFIAVLIILGCWNVPAQAVPVQATEGKAASIPSGAIIEGKPVKNAPYSAEAVNEIVTLLADGNRIVNNAVTKIFRDSEGRTRRESGGEKFPYVPPISVTAPFQAKIAVNWRPEIWISDPVSGDVYLLDPQTHTAKKYAMMTFVEPTVIAAEVDRIHASNSDKKPAPVRAVEAAQSPDLARMESLGTRIIEGVDCTGILTTTTIPAGQIGNEKPIVITEESWYSQKLQADVLRKRFDPRSGENIYKLANLSQSEPAAALFQVPPDYKLIDVPEEEKNANRILRPFSGPDPIPGPPVIPGKNSEEAASVCADLASSSTKATLAERIEDYYLSARCYQRTGQLNDAMLIYAKAEILGRRIEGNAAAAKAREILEQLYRAVHNNSVLGIEKIYRKAEESLSRSEK